VTELHDHRFAVNHVIATNTSSRLEFSLFNNDGLAADDPGRNQRLVKRVTTDRHGALRLYYNTSNEVPNAATASWAEFATDTWPRLLLVQQFSDVPKLVEFKRLDFTLTFRVLRERRLSD